MPEKQKTFRFDDGTWLIATHRQTEKGLVEVELEANIKLDLCVHTVLDFGNYADEAEAYFETIGNKARDVYSNLRLTYYQQADRKVDLK